MPSGGSGPSATRSKSPTIHTSFLSAEMNNTIHDTIAEFHRRDGQN